MVFKLVDASHDTIDLILINDLHVVYLLYDLCVQHVQLVVFVQLHVIPYW